MTMKWYSGSTEEYFQNGPFDTREEAVDALDGEGGWVIEAETYAIAFSAQRLIEDQYFEDNGVFDWDHLEPDRLQGAVEADVELQHLLDDWLDKWRHTFVQPNMFYRHGVAQFIDADL